MSIPTQNQISWVILWIFPRNALCVFNPRYFWRWIFRKPQWIAIIRRCSLGGLCNMVNLSETNLKLKYHHISLVHNIHLGCPMVSKSFTKCGIATTVIYAKFQNDLTTGKIRYGKRDVSRIGLLMRFGWISHFPQGNTNYFPCKSPLQH